jgi:hypothetical protein
VANNRAYLYCPDCGATHFLCKELGGSWHRTDAMTDLDVTGFFDRHGWHMPKASDNPGIEVRYENHSNPDKELPVPTPPAKLTKPAPAATPSPIERSGLGLVSLHRPQGTNGGEAEIRAPERLSISGEP